MIHNIQLETIITYAIICFVGSLPFLWTYLFKKYTFPQIGISSEDNSLYVDRYQHNGGPDPCVDALTTIEEISLPNISTQLFVKRY